MRRLKRTAYNYFFRYLLALFPRLQYSEYILGSTPGMQDGRKYVVIWYSWLGHTFWEKRYLLDSEDGNF